MKYKVDEVVRITSCVHGHEFTIGELVTIEEVCDSANNYEAYNGKEAWTIEDDEIEPLEST